MRRDPEVTHNYAHAFLNVIRKSSMSMDEVRDESIALRQILEERPQLYVFFVAPQFRDEDKVALATKAFKDNTTVYFYHLILQLLKNHRIDYLQDVLTEIEQMILTEQGITLGRVRTAVPLSEDEQNRMRERLEAFTNRKFTLRFKVDQDLIGGVKVKYDDILMDTSIQSYLNDLRAKLNQVRLAS